MNRLHLGIELIRRLGWRWILFRASYELRLRTGLIRWLSPACDWADRPLLQWLKPGIPSTPTSYALWRKSHTPDFFFERLPAPPDAHAQTAVTTQAEKLLAGEWTYFSRLPLKHPFPPPWHVHPITGNQYPPNQHWSEIDDFSWGDVKFMWEPARFGSAFLLARAYAYSGDERHPEAFWTLVMDWRQHNPPGRGVHWKSGQELAIRLMGWVWGLYAFAHSPHTTSEWISALVQMIAVHAHHIDQHHAYARSQKNNHAILEGVALFTVGLLFPEFLHAQRWQERGKTIIEREVMRQVYPDGAYMQHSPNYERLMLDGCLWAVQLGKIHKVNFKEKVINRLESATQFLSALMEPDNGRLPNLGHNDGALLLPLTQCDFNDYRPSLELAHVILEGKRRLVPDSNGDQPWAEALHWMIGVDLPPIESLPPEADLIAPQGGCYTLHGNHSWALIRCASYQDRPAHADQLQVDLWWQGENILIDAGTYRYNDDPPWNNGLARTAAHNTVMVDGVDQMTRAGRFLWLDWARGWVCHQLKTPEFTYWEGEHGGYQRLDPPVRHRRGVLLLPGDLWLVVDRLCSKGVHEYGLGWLVNPHSAVPLSIQALNKEARYDLIKSADSTQIEGWFSRYYGIREQALHHRLTVRGDEVTFCTVIGEGALAINPEDYRQISLTTVNKRVNITLDQHPQGRLINRVWVGPKT